MALQEEVARSHPGLPHRATLAVETEGRSFFLRRESSSGSSAGKRAPLPASNSWRGRRSLVSCLSSSLSGQTSVPEAERRASATRPVQRRSAAPPQQRHAPEISCSSSSSELESSDESSSTSSKPPGSLGVASLSDSSSTTLSPGRKTPRKSPPFVRPSQFTLKSLSSADRIRFTELQIKHALLKRAGFLVKAHVERAGGAVQVVRFYEGLHGRAPGDPDSCLKAVFRRDGPAPAPWRLCDYRLPIGLQAPIEDLDKMATLSDAAAWLRAVRQTLRAHQERQHVFEELRSDWRLFPNPEKQVFSISSHLLRVNFQFPVPAECRLNKSCYDLSVWAHFAGDCSVLPETTKVFTSEKEQVPQLEAALNMVRDVALDQGMSSSPRPRFESPLLELVRDWWWDALSTLLAEAEAAAARNALPKGLSPSPSPSPALRSASSSASSFSSPIPSPVTLHAAVVGRRLSMSPNSPSPPGSSLHWPAQRRSARRTILARRSRDGRRRDASPSSISILAPTSRRVSALDAPGTSQSAAQRGSPEGSEDSSDHGNSSDYSSSGDWIVRRSYSYSRSRNRNRGSLRGPRTPARGSAGKRSRTMTRTS